MPTSAPPPPSLAGVRVVITRAEHQARGLTAAFEGAGARVEVLPLLAVVPAADPRPLDRAAAELPLYDWLLFTSANAVEAFLPFTGGSLPGRLKVAAIGPATSRALRAWEVAVDLQAGRSDAEGLAAALAPHLSRRQRVLLPQAADARPTLAERLTAAGGEVVALTAYDKALPPRSRERARHLFAGGPLGWVTFTSPRIVRHFVEVLGGEWPRRRGGLLAASIGPVTTAELRRQGVDPAAEAASPADEELVRAVAVAAGS